MANNMEKSNNNLLVSALAFLMGSVIFAASVACIFQVKSVPTEEIQVATSYGSNFASENQVEEPIYEEQSMLKINYRNPLTKMYQYEYGCYKAISELLQSVSCKSKSLETLGLYYAEMVKTNESGAPSYAKQKEIDKECKKLIDRDAIGWISAHDKQLSCRFQDI